jgi:pimeloyl-ACP methyl ester carboxylesterase
MMSRMSAAATLRVREHGTAGPTIFVLHGGPAAPGSAGPLARGLSDSFRVIEPFQRGSDAEPLTVARHVADLHALISARCGDERPALVGWSWGAMLALAYAADHPDSVGPIVLVGCGTFDPLSRAALVETRRRRITPELRRTLDRLAEEGLDSDTRLARQYELTRPLEYFDPIAYEADDQDAVEPFDGKAHFQTWADMLRLQEQGVYPAAFRAIRSPVLMLHGDYDPHPGRMIHETLRPFVERLEYRELPRCGHYPWNERNARDALFAIVHDWLLRHFCL